MNARKFAACLAVAFASCAAPTERVPVDASDRPAAAPVPFVAAPPAPQVMVAPPSSVGPEQVLLQPMSEAERRKILLPSANSIAPYAPAPLPTRHGARAAPETAPQTVIVERETARVAAAPCTYRYYPYRPWEEDVAGVARLATYTAAGAIIGHQFHERGRGAAIGAGLALLSWPFGGWYFGDRCGW